MVILSPTASPKYGDRGGALVVMIKQRDVFPGFENLRAMQSMGQANMPP